MSRPQELSNITGSSDPDATSLSLLFRLKSNDAAAWDRLVSLYAPLVHYWCRKFSLPDQDMADVFQDVFQAVAANIREFRKERPSDTFRGWLRIITHHKVNDHFRRQGRQPQAAGGSDANRRISQLISQPDNVDEQDDEQAYQQLVHRALELIRNEFTPRTWQAFWRVAVDGLRPVDVAEDLQMQPGAVRVAKSRVLQRLRLELGELLE